MIGWAKELFPLTRSLTGDGVRKTLAFLREINPELVVHSFATGEQVFDWTVPKEWRIRDAYFEHVDSGQRFAEMAKCNLHVMGYSEPVNRRMEKAELLRHVYTQVDQPDTIPYVTSYYSPRFGFCISENVKQALPDGIYHARIDSELFDGEMLVGEVRLQGASDEEVMFSTYVCHPSMANNELSGPVLATALIKFIKEKFPSPRFSYRFVFGPETIGSLAYLSRNLDLLKARVVCGFNLSCVGDERAYSHVQSRYGNTLADKALRAALRGRENVKTYSYLERGSDERQYCAPGIDLPVAGFCRSKYGEYPEYHTSDDNFDVVTAAGLQGAFDVMREIVQAFETGLCPVSAIKGEPQLGKRGLYPTLSQKGSYSAVRARMDFLAYADGSNSLFDIAEIIEVPLEVVIQEAALMLQHGLVIAQANPQFDRPQRRFSDGVGGKTGS
jgi:aminopeptidase-like protein